MSLARYAYHPPVRAQPLIFLLFAAISLSASANADPESSTSSEGVAAQIRKPRAAASVTARAATGPVPNAPVGTRDVLDAPGHPEREATSAPHSASTNTPNPSPSTQESSALDTPEPGPASATRVSPKPAVVVLPPAATLTLGAASSAAASSFTSSNASAAPAATSATVSTRKPASVRVGENEVFSLRSGTDAELERRARLARTALTAAVENGLSEVSVRPEGSNFTLYAGDLPIVQLSPEDATLAGATSPEVYAQQVATAVRRGIEAELRRGQIAKNVFAASLVVFLGLVAFFLLRKVSEFADWLKQQLDASGDKLSLRIRDIELIRPEMLQSTALVGVGIARWLGRLGIVYLWLITVLSLFESTRGYTEKLTGFVLAPLYQLMGRLATALPLMLVAVLGVVAVAILVRFVELLFASVARSETTVAFVAPDVAPAASVLLRFGIVIGALVFAAPVITGDPDGAFARLGTVALVAIALASTPLLASVLLGATFIFTRRIKVGEFASMGETFGKVTHIDLLETRIQTPEGTDTRVPHLFLLRTPTTRHGTEFTLALHVHLSSIVSLTDAIGLLQQTTKPYACASVQLLTTDPVQSLFQVSARFESPAMLQRATLEVLDALKHAGFALGPSGVRIAKPQLGGSTWTKPVQPGTGPAAGGVS